jgi:hypothetical protein
LAFDAVNALAIYENVAVEDDFHGPRS